jgi:hypothetical protein
MPLPQIKITTWKDGRQVARFRDNQGLVRTRVGPLDWTRAEQVKQLADYGIALQVAQARAGLGANGQPMPALKGSTRAVFAARVNNRAVFARKTYADRKAAAGLQPIRDLYAFGKGGHMLDDIRINYLDDRRATIAITNKSSRDKARGNERHAQWWGWSPASYGKLRDLAFQLFPVSMAQRLAELGLISISAVSAIKRRYWKAA